MFTLTITFDPSDRSPFAPWFYLWSVGDRQYAGRGNSPEQAMNRAVEWMTEMLRSGESVGNDDDDN